MKIKNLSIVRNTPFIDCKGLGFYYQKYETRYWIEIPFLAISFNIIK